MAELKQIFKTEDEGTENELDKFFELLLIESQNKIRKKTEGIKTP